MKPSIGTKSSIWAAIIAAITASLCCVGPLVLLMLGIGGAWVSTLTQLEFLRPFSIVIALVFLFIAFWKLHFSQNKCAIDKPCGTKKGLFLYRIMFWIVSVLILALLAFPMYAHLFY